MTNALSNNSLLFDQTILRSKLDPKEHLIEEFGHLTRTFRRFFELNKGVLVLNDSTTGLLNAVAGVVGSAIRSGSDTPIDENRSIFRVVVQQALPYVEGFCVEFSGNACEQELLMEEHSQSYVIVPLKHEATVIGLVAFSSPRPFAFAAVSEERLEQMTAEFSETTQRFICAS